jgi:hypothetical protein
MRDFLLYFFESKLSINHLKFIRYHLIPLFENYKKKFKDLGKEYYYINETNFQIDYWKEDIERVVVSNEMRRAVYKLNKSRDFFITKLRNLFPRIIYFTSLELKAGGRNSLLGTAHIIL